jgi:hydrogenase nickel incorporation protein HypA/HybF
MHELSIAESIVDIAGEALEAQGNPAVREIVLDIGALSGIEIDALEFALDVVVRGTPLDGAAITINRIPATGKCDDCGAEAPRDDFFSPCPRCGSFAVQTTTGTELKVRELFVEEERG